MNIYLRLRYPFFLVMTLLIIIFEFQLIYTQIPLKILVLKRLAYTLVILPDLALPSFVSACQGRSWHIQLDLVNVNSPFLVVIDVIFV